MKRDRRQRRLGTAAVLLLTGVALWAALGFLGPRHAVPVASISLWPQCAAALLFLSLFLLLQRRWLSAGSGLVIAGALAAMVAPGYRAAGPPLDRPDLTLVWSNLYGRKEAMDRSVSFADSSNANLLAVGEWSGRIGVPDGWALACRWFGAVIMARTDQTVPSCSIAAPSGRGLLIATIPTDGGTIELVVVHAMMPLSPHGVPRRTRDIARVAAHAATPNTVAIGDFNTVSWSSALAPIEAAGLRRVPYGVRNSWMGVWIPFGLPIDHAFIGEGLDARAEIGPFTGSDHRPLLVTVSFRD